MRASIPRLILFLVFVQATMACSDSLLSFLSDTERAVAVTSVRGSIAIVITFLGAWLVANHLLGLLFRAFARERRQGS